MFKIPFGWLPAHWGLSGKPREEAKIYYEISDPYEQGLALLTLRKTSESDFLIQKLDFDLKFSKITKKEYDFELARLKGVGDENITALNILDVKLKYGEITEIEHEKQTSTIKNEPWVGIKNSNFNPKEGLGGLAFELDWNEQFIAFLAENGYKGITDQQVVEAWFNDLCKSVVAEDGLEEYMAAMENTNTTSILPVINRKNLDGNTTEFS